MTNKARMNYWLGLFIALAFVVSAVSGLLLFLMPEGGYQGGRNPHYGWKILFMDEHGWKDLHTWGSIAMTGGVLAHLIVHWNWMVKMTRNMLRRLVRGRQSGARNKGVGAPASSQALQTR